MDITADLAQTLTDIRGITAGPEPDRDELDAMAALLAGFAARHGEALTFEHFPLPGNHHDAMCSYEIHHEDGSGLTLYLNAIRGGIDSVIHDHGTWAIIVGLSGQERNRLYQGDPSDGTLALEREAIVCQGDTLVLETGHFHSIYTTEPALQLHLYGQPIDRMDGRRLVDPESGQTVYIAPSGS